jgi:glycosyltransferase involved in cell wall biosynthesis
MINGISVIMPTYNQSTFIRRAITSLQKQGYTQWELIIINDGSTDKTDYYLSDVLNDERIRYIKNRTNTKQGNRKLV